MSPLLLHSNINQYNTNGLLCTYTEMFRIQTCCNHILSAAARFRGRRQHAMIQAFLLALFSPQLILQFKEAFQWFILLRIKLILYQGYRGGPLFFGGGVQLFPGGPNASFYRNPYTYLLFSRGVSGPPIRLWIRAWAVSS